MPNPSPNPMIYDGAMHGSSRNVINQSFEQCLFAVTTPVQATNPTSATNLMTQTLQAGTLNHLGQTLQIYGAGIINLTTSTSTVTIAVILNGVTLATFTTTAAAISLNLGWNLNIEATVASIDGFGNVTLETHGSLQAALTTAAGAATAFNDTNTAVSSSIPGAQPLLLQFQATIGSGNAASFVNQRQMLVESFN